MAKEKIRLLLVENDPADVKKFKAYVKTVRDIELVGCTTSASEGIALVLKLRPDGLVLDLELTEGDGLDFLLQLEKLPSRERPYVVVTTNTTAQMTLQALRDHGAGFILGKNIRGYGSRQVADKFRMVQKYLRSCPAEEESPQPNSLLSREDMIRRRLSSDLEMLGITPNLKGHRYIIDAVLLMIATPEGNVSRSIYPAVAEKHQKQVANVERCIRSAIETAWASTTPEELHRVYTAAVRMDKGKPMNKEFLSFFAAKYGER